MRKLIAVVGAVAAGLTVAAPAQAADRNEFHPEPGYTITVDLGHTDISGEPDGVPDGTLVYHFDDTYTLEDASPMFQQLADQAGLVRGTWDQWRDVLTAGTDVTQHPQVPRVTTYSTSERPGTAKVRFRAGVGAGVAHWEIMKRNPRNGYEWVYRRGTVTGGQTIIKHVTFPRAHRPMEVFPVVDGAERATTTVDPVKWAAKAKVQANVSPRWRSAVVRVRGVQPKGTVRTKYGTLYRVQVRNPRTGKAWTVRRGRVSGGEHDVARVRLAVHRRGAFFRVVRVVSGGKVVDRAWVRVRAVR